MFAHPYQGLSESSELMLSQAHEAQLAFQLPEITPATLLISLLNDATIQPIVRYCGVIAGEMQQIIRAYIPVYQQATHNAPLAQDSQLDHVVVIAVDELMRFGGRGMPVEPIHFLLALIRINDNEIDPLLKGATLTYEHVKWEYRRSLGMA